MACSEIQNDLDALRDAIEALRESLDKIKPIGIGSILQRLARLEAQAKVLQAEDSRIGSKASSALQQAGSALTQAQALGATLYGVKLIADRANKTATTAAQGVGGLKQAMGILGGKLDDVAKNNVVAFKRSKQALDAAKASSDLASKAKSAAGEAKKVADNAGRAISGIKSRADKAFEKAGQAISGSAANKQAIRGLAGKLAGVAAKLLNIVGLISSFITIAQLAALTIRLGKTEGVVSGHERRIGALENFMRKVPNSILSAQAYVLKELEAFKDRVGDRFFEQNGRINQLSDWFRKELEKNYRDHARLEQSFNSKINNLGNWLNSQLSKLDNKWISTFNNLKSSISSQFNDLKQWVNSQLLKLDNKWISSFNNLKNWVLNLLKTFNPNIAIGSIAAAAAALALARLLPLIPNLIKQNSPKMTCRFNDIAANRAASEAARANRTTTILNTFTQGALYKQGRDGFAGTFLRLGEPIANGGIAGKLLRFTKSQLWDKVMQSLTFLVVLHNAMFLSKSIVTTLGDTLSVGLSVIGVKDDDDNPIDINKVLGTAANDFMSRILGETRWTQLKATIAQYSRTYQAAANAIQTVRSIGDSTLTVAQFTAEQVSKIGNGLKADGVVNWNAYAWMPEIVTPQNAWLTRLSNLDEAASAVSMATNEVKSVQDESKELADQVAEFKKQSEAAQKQKAQLADAWDDNSISPAIDKKDIGAD